VDVDAADAERRRRRVEFQSLPAQVVHRFGGVGLRVLPGRNHPSVDGAIPALVHGAPALAPVVVQVGRPVPRHVVEREQDGRFLDVRVRARAPVDGRQRRIRTEPLAARRRRGRGDLVRVGAVALHLVEPPDRVVRVRDEEQVVGHPAVVEPVGPHARHAALRHLHHVVLGEHPPFVDGDRVERFVVRTRSGARVQVRLRLVQVVQHGRRPLEKCARGVLREVEELSHAVAVVVVLHVLAPVHERQLRRGTARPCTVASRRLAARIFLVPVVGVYHLLVPVHFHHRRDERDDVFPDLLDERRFLDRQSVGELHQHLRPAALRRVDAARDPVDRLRGLQQALRLRLGRPARIREPVEHPLVLLELPDGLLVRDREHHHLAPFFGLADGPVFRAGTRLRDRGQVPVDVPRVRQLARRPDDAAEERERRRHSARRRQVIHQLGRDAGVRKVLPDLRRILGIDGLCGLLRAEQRWECEQSRGGEHAHAAADEWHDREGWGDDR
jgi:hypothetical protein